jgi:hypothetical protein
MMQVVAASSPQLAQMNRLLWLKTTGSFLKSRGAARDPYCRIEARPGKQFLFAEILEKQRLQLRMSREELTVLKRSWF